MSRAGTLGLIVNPIAGIGGPLGLKGSDGEAAEIAKARGAPKVAPTTCRTFLKHITKRRPHPTIYAWAGEMGEDECAAVGVPHTPLGTCKDTTGPQDTVEAVNRLVDTGIQLLTIVGGDGTARDVAHPLRGRKIPKYLKGPTTKRCYSKTQKM